MRHACDRRRNARIPRAGTRKCRSGSTPRLDRPAVVGPVQNRLSLSSPALEVTSFAVLADRRHVSRDGAPAPDLPAIVRRAPSAVVAAVPLKPAARILRTNPALMPPFGQRLRRLHAEEVEARIVLRWTEPGARKPA